MKNMARHGLEHLQLEPEYKEVLNPCMLTSSLNLTLRRVDDH